MMQHCINHVRQNAPGATIGLDATPEGYPLYLKLGFNVTTHLWRCRIDTDNVNTGNVSTRFDRNLQENAIFDYAKDKKIPASQDLLTRLIKHCPQGCFIASRGQDCVGFVMSRPGRVAPFIGPLFADDLDIARSLFGIACRVWLERGYDNIFIDVVEDHFLQKNNPENSEPGMPSGHLLSDHIHPVRPFIRMQLDIPANAAHKEFLPFRYPTFGPEFG
jgi:hypothetical protein